MQPRVWHRFYDEGVPPGLDFEARPLPAFLERSAREHADATALIFLNRQLTYRQFKEDVDRFATALSALGVERRHAGRHPVAELAANRDRVLRQSCRSEGLSS